MKRLLTIALMASAISLVGISATKKHIKLVYNASASVPVGLYYITPAKSLKHGDLVLIRPPEELSIFLASRRYLPINAVLLKHIAALPEQTVCRSGNIISIEKMLVATALATDRFGRPLPVWHGCLTLSENQIFTLNPNVQDSLDSRYFGALPRAAIIGHATPLFILKTQSP